MLVFTPVSEEPLGEKQTNVIVTQHLFSRCSAQVFKTFLSCGDESTSSACGLQTGCKLQQAVLFSKAATNGTNTRNVDDVACRVVHKCSFYHRGQPRAQATIWAQRRGRSHLRHKEHHSHCSATTGQLHFTTDCHNWVNVAWLHTEVMCACWGGA